MSVEQLFYTHCTRKTSAVERAAGQGADAALGYGPRAASVGGGELATLARFAQAYLSYGLPRDLTPAERAALTDRDAPRRLFFLPATGGQQIIGQVCHRPHEAVGNRESYFAHLLFQSEAGEPWDALDALRLWSAPGWTARDSAAIAHDLPSLASSNELLAGRPPAIDDDLLLAFLTAPAHADVLHERGEAIPPRWRAMPPHVRQGLLLHTFEYLLALDPQSHGSVVLLAEPSAAALLFYGVLRLLPAGCRRIGFSTYQGPQSRNIAPLSAVCFAKDETARQTPPARLGPQAVNTSLPPDALPAQAVGYAATLLRLLVDCGWKEVDARLRHFEAAGAASLDDLKALLPLDKIAQELLLGSAPPDGLWQSARAFGYVRSVVAKALAGRHAPHVPPLDKIIGSAAHGAVLDLLAAEPEPPDTGRALRLLLRQLPADCERLCRPRPGAGTSGGFGYPMSSVLARLGDGEALELFAAFRARQCGEFLCAALEVARRFKDREPLIDALLESLTDEQFATLDQLCGPAFLEALPDSPRLRRRLERMVEGLHLGPADLGRRLDFLARCDRWMSQSYRDAVGHWALCRAAIERIVALQHKTPLGRANGERLADGCRDLARGTLQLKSLGFLPPFATSGSWAAGASPEPGPAVDSRGRRRPPAPPGGDFDQTRQSLRAAALAITGEELLPDIVAPFGEMWGRIRDFLQTGIWDGHAAPPPTDKSRARFLTLPALVGGLMVAMLLAAGWFAWQMRPATPPPEESPRLAAVDPEPPAQPPKAETTTTKTKPAEIQPPGEQSKTAEPAKTAPAGEQEPPPPEPTPHVDEAHPPVETIGPPNRIVAKANKIGIPDSENKGPIFGQFEIWERDGQKVNDNWITRLVCECDVLAEDESQKFGTLRNKTDRIDLKDVQRPPVSGTQSVLCRVTLTARAPTGKTLWTAECNKTFKVDRGYRYDLRLELTAETMWRLKEKTLGSASRPVQIQPPDEPKPETADLPPPKEDDFPKWSENASRYAAENKALFYPRREMQAGVWTLPVADFGGKPLDGQKYWVGGRLELGDYSEAFRVEATSGLIIELPKLAEVHRLKRARLTVSPKEADGVQFSFYFEFFESPAEAAKEVDGKIKDAEAKLAKLSALLKRPPGSDRKALQSFRDELRNILGPDHEALQGLPSRPDKKAFPDERIFREAEHQWNDRYDEWLKKLPLKAMEVLVSLGKTALPQLRRQKQDKMKAAAEKNEERETELKSKPWRLSVVFGIDGEDLSRTPKVPIPVVDSPAFDEGRIEWRASSLSGPRDGPILQQFAVWVGGRRMDLPDINKQCIVLSEAGDVLGALSRPSDSVNLKQTSIKVRCRVTFSAKNQTGQTVGTLQYTSPLKELYDSRRYDVRFDLTHAGLSQLQRLAKKAAPPPRAGPIIVEPAPEPAEEDPFEPPPGSMDDGKPAPDPTDQDPFAPAPSPMDEGKPDPAPKNNKPARGPNEDPFAPAM